ncbi:MAG: MerR family transcriptional regulator [Streptosporangiales bacterium]|nr:MerR family transcriptional regulator [Streptosporangiales bacterium]
MRIGELAELAGTSARALRYYEAQGLLRARRTSNGYRDYGEDDLRVVREIRSLLALGFGLEETRPFVECLRDGHEAGDTCPDSIAVYRRKLGELDACLERMRTVRDHVARQLEGALRERAAAGPAVPVLESGEPRCFFSVGNGVRGEGV